MRQALRIDEKDSRGILIGLVPILEALEPEASKLWWRMFDLWITGDLGKGKSVLELEERSRKTPNDLCVDWLELKTFAKTVDQIIDGTFVGGENCDAIPNRSDSTMFRSCEVVIRAVDSSFWEIVVNRANLIKRLRQRFPDAVDIT